MDAIGPLRHRLSLLLGSERGMALPTALLAVTIAFSLASASVVFSVDVQHGTVRDHSAKEAIAAADAGVSVAQLRLNQFGNALGTSSCLRLSGGILVVGTAEADGWCPEMTGTVASATYSYRVGPTEAVCAATGGSKCVVAIGTENGVSRRVAVSLGTSTTGGAFSKAGAIGQNSVRLDNNAEARVGVGTNGNITLENNASICGNARHGVGKSGPTAKELSCGGQAEEEEELLPPVSSFMPEDIATNNSDYRLELCTGKDAFGNLTPAGCESDSYTKKWTSTTPWNPTTRTIEPAQNSSLTLTGGDYFVCRLMLSNNSHLIIGEEATVRIFFDTPENCGIKAGEAQVSVSNNADITDSGYQPTEDKFAAPGLYLTGSATIATTAEFSNNSGTSEFVLYAPNTDVVIENHGSYKGAIAGKSLTLENHATIEQDAGFEPPQIGGATLYSRQAYVECVGATGTPPDTSC